MKLRLLHAAKTIEHDDDFHLAQLLLLLKACGKKSNKPVDGITKLAKLDFLLRYPNCLDRMLTFLERPKDAAAVANSPESRSIEAGMIRFRYGPWDGRYRRWIGILVAKGLAETSLDGRTVIVNLTESGRALANVLASDAAFDELQNRAKIIATALGDVPPTRLKDLVYRVIPEIVNMKWGERIHL